jgi:hypothetical protein
LISDGALYRHAWIDHAAFAPPSLDGGMDSGQARPIFADVQIKETVACCSRLRAATGAARADVRFGATAGALRHKSSRVTGMIACYSHRRGDDISCTAQLSATAAWPARQTLFASLTITAAV